MKEVLIKMKKIIVTNAGRSAGLNFSRSLRLAPEKYKIIGLEQNKYSLMNAEADKKFLCPDADSPDYIPYLKEIIKNEKVDVVYPSKTNNELWLISKKRDELGAKVFLPDDNLIRIYEDKFKTYEILKKNNIKVPNTILINTEEDLRHAFKLHPSALWLRAIKGCGGKGSIIARNYEFAHAWIDNFDGWGSFTAAEVLTDKTASWSAIWKDGELVVSQIRRRLYWEFGYLSPSGVTGITGAQITDRDKQLDEIAIKTIKSVTPCPDGIVSVDFTYDEKGIPNPTEIQASRFFTSTYFMAKAGLNLPYIWLKLALGEDIEEINNKFSPLEPNLLWIKYVDCPPVLTTVDDINKFKKFDVKEG
jgi:predicted ATP-grasp superfamily ATP-dependent carboligase